MQTMQKSVQCQAHYKNDKLSIDTRACLFSKLLAFDIVLNVVLLLLLLDIDLQFWKEWEEKDLFPNPVTPLDLLHLINCEI
jgi:hypothetical protein